MAIHEESVHHPSLLVHLRRKELRWIFILSLHPLVILFRIVILSLVVILSSADVCHRVQQDLLPTRETVLFDPSILALYLLGEDNSTGLRAPNLS